MTRTDVDAWLASYVAAWKSYDPEDIAALFSEDAEYRYHPYDEPIRGNRAIAKSWTEEDRRDAPGSFEASYRTVAVDGDVAVATGTSSYFDDSGSVDRIYENCFVMRFGPDGRCRAFTEWYLRRPG